MAAVVTVVVAVVIALVMAGGADRSAGRRGRGLLTGAVPGRPDPVAA
ncbi:hypothetical protein ACIBCS_11660 [Streptomyces phaeochromogenes]